MNLFSLFQSSTSDQQQAERINYQQRYEYGLREVERWTQIRKNTIKNGEDTDRRFQVAIQEHAQKWGTEGEGMKILRWNMECFREQTEKDLQEADYRLTIYRNIVLMKGQV